MQLNHKTPPFFITFEGGDGAGKSTQIELLSSFLKNQQIDHLVTREPGGTSNAEKLRNLLLDTAKNWDPVSEAFLMAAARRDHLKHVIWPALREKKWVLCDRFSDSTLAYQGYGHGLGKEFITTLNHLTMGDFSPSLTFIFRLPFHEGMKRKKKLKDRFESFDPSFHRKALAAFDLLCQENPKRCIAIDGSQSIEEIRSIIQGHITSHCFSTAIES